MRRAPLFLIGMLLGVGLGHAPAAAAPSQASEPSVGAQALAAKTVALVQSNGAGGVHPHCSGVWVSRSSILTALHCVDGDAIVGYATHEDAFPPGTQTVDETLKPRAALTYAIDRDHDLALLRAFEPPAAHGVAQTRIGTVEQGSFAQTMGQPFGFWFTYASGDVSSVRTLDFGEGRLLLVQSTVATSPGCSGAGLFDRVGDLIGIAHRSSKYGQALNFFVHKAHVETFLQAQGSPL